jgi:hypothetical protein
MEDAPGTAPVYGYAEGKSETDMAALLPMILVASHVMLVADRVPNFDLTPTCRADLNSREACQRDEREAQHKLQQNWQQYTPAQRESCLILSRTGGDPSYVELLTCLEMAQQASKLPKDMLNDSGTR